MAQTASCSASDAEAQTTIRARLADWVSATNRGDRATTRDIWAPGLVGWFPGAAVFGDSAAYAAAGVRYSTGSPSGEITYELRVEDVAASGGIAAVHDVWTETRRLPGGLSVRRILRGSELWKCSPDGKWRIARYVSAPEPWTLVK